MPAISGRGTAVSSLCPARPQQARRGMLSLGRRPIWTTASRCPAPPGRMAFRAAPGTPQPAIRAIDLLTQVHDAPASKARDHALCQRRLGALRRLLWAGRKRHSVRSCSGRIGRIGRPPADAPPMPPSRRNSGQGWLEPHPRKCVHDLGCCCPGRSTMVVTMVVRERNSTSAGSLALATLITLS